MKTKAVSRISALLLGVIAVGVFAHAERAFAVFEEVPAEQAEQIAPLPPDFWNHYNRLRYVDQSDKERSGEGMSTQGHVETLDMGTVLVGTIVLDVLVNLGKKIWSVIEAGRPALNVEMNSASAVPTGIKDWTELYGWKDPVAKLYRAQLLTSHGYNEGDIYYRLVYTYGGGYNGQGQYLANVTVIPADLRIPYFKTVYAKTTVLQVLNQGTKTNPIAGITMLLQWGIDSQYFGRTMQSVTIHVRGDGKVRILPLADDLAEDIKPPVRKLSPNKSRP